MEIICKYFSLTKQQDEQFGVLQEIYFLWNSRINVVSRKDMENLYERHVLHSLSIAKVIQFKDNTCLLDAGTGGGFPGIPLAILFPSCNFCLVDSIGKKIVVVKAVAERLGLNNVNAIQQRVEKIDGKFDFVLCRAVTYLPVFFSWVSNKIKAKSFNELPNGILYLKGGEVENEIKQIGQKPLKFTNQVYALKDFFEEEFFETKKLIHIGFGNCKPINEVKS
jgi:16S rRNA (guanine527-N7)-methyltransferase